MDVGHEEEEVVGGARAEDGDGLSYKAEEGLEVRSGTNSGCK